MLSAALRNANFKKIPKFFDKILTEYRVILHTEGLVLLEVNNQKLKHFIL